MTIKAVRIFRWRKEGHHGDRATKLSPYFDYEVRIVNGNDARFCVKEFGGYDGFHCSIKKSEPIKADVDAYAYNLAAFLGVENLPMVTMVKKVITQESWVEEGGDDDE